MPSPKATSWKKLTKKHTRDAEFQPPATEKQLAAVEKALGVRLPGLLRGLLLETNGIAADYGSDIVWPADDLLSRNREFRSEPGFRDLYMPFDHLLFFGEDGGGDQFAFAIHADGRIHKTDVFRWEHETDARSWFAGDLKGFIVTRLKDEEDAA